MKRLDGRFGYIRSCRLPTRSGGIDVQTELLGRVLEEPAVNISFEQRARMLRRRRLSASGRTDRHRDGR